MSNSHPVLTPFQCGALHEAAHNPARIFVVALPSRRTDCKFIQGELDTRYDAVRELVNLGLVESVTHQYGALLRQHKMSGRRFLAFELTEAGYTLFHDADSRSVN